MAADFVKAMSAVTKEDLDALNAKIGQLQAVQIDHAGLDRLGPQIRQQQPGAEFGMELCDVLGMRVAGVGRWGVGFFIHVVSVLVVRGDCCSAVFPMR